MNYAGTLHRLAAFTTDPSGGNPAGVWIGSQLPDQATMLQIAAEVGYSETAFIAPDDGFERTIRYFSPLAEVPFCGHATIAAGIVLAEAGGDGEYRLSSAVGLVPVSVETTGGTRRAALTSVEPRHTALEEPTLTEIFDSQGWTRSELDPGLPPANAYAGNWHPVIAAYIRKL